MEANTTAARPAAGPLTLVWEPLMNPIMIPPMIPEIIPDIKGAPEASAIPRHNGKATRNTTSPAGISVFNALMFMIQKKMAECFIRPNITNMFQAKIILQTWGLLQVMDHPHLQWFHVQEVQVLALEAH